MRKEEKRSGLDFYLDHGVSRESIKFVYPANSLDILQKAGAEHGVQIIVLATGGNEYATSLGQQATVPCSQTLIEISHRNPNLSNFWVRVSELDSQRQQEQTPS